MHALGLQSQTKSKFEKRRADRVDLHALGLLSQTKSKLQTQEWQLACIATKTKDDIIILLEWPLS